SRRRHTRSKRDWSSDVCSSDLAASSENKKNARPAISSGVPNLFNGTDSRVCSAISSDNISFSAPPVLSIGPGAIAFVRIPKRVPHSTANVRVKLSTPALPVALCATAAPASHSYVATMLTIDPLCFVLIQCLPTAWLQYNVPFKTISITEFHPFGDKSSAKAMKLPAALLTK